MFIQDETFNYSDKITTDAFDFNINRAAKWHNLNNRGCNPRSTSTPPGLPEGFLVFTVGCTHGYSN